MACLLYCVPVLCLLLVQTICMPVVLACCDCMPVVTACLLLLHTCWDCIPVVNARVT